MKSSTVESPNKGHVGDSINLAVLSFIERLSSFRGFQCIYNVHYRKNYLNWDLEQCPL